VRPPSRPAAAEPGYLPRWILEEIRATAARGRADQAIELFQEAVRHLQDGAPARAAAAAARAKAIASRSGAIREVLGIALYRTERYREALRELQAYRRVTGRADQNHLIADSYRALGEPDKAIEPAMEALRAEISEEARAEATIVGGAALADLGRLTEALGVLRSFPSDARLARSFDLRLWYITGDVLERAGRPGEAAEEFRRVVRHDPDAFDAAERLARLT
jgi:tetratricopeptide (TPR) repeat protein